jgi:hypothetical protein
MRVFTKVLNVVPATLGGAIVTNNGDTCWKVETLVAKVKSIRALSTKKPDRVTKTVWQCTRPVGTDWVLRD